MVNKKTLLKEVGGGNYRLTAPQGRTIYIKGEMTGRL